MDISQGEAAASGAAAAARRGGLARLLEHSRSTVTESKSAEEQVFEVVKCGCRCWFCADCCLQKGLRLRAELVPILRTFGGLMMLTFTIDPELFSDPRTAYVYVMRRRCLSRTIQDLHRWGHLLSRRYFYVVEFQRRTLQAHFHVLVDASFIPFESLLASWSKHRPATAGPVREGRPPFGTVLFSKREFGGGPVHAARYATKYTIKVPEEGFPAWVMQMGRDRRVKRYGASLGFWQRPPEVRRPGDGTRTQSRQSYGERVRDCGSSLDVFEVQSQTDVATGEVFLSRQWRGRLLAPAAVLGSVGEAAGPRGRRRVICGPSLRSVAAAVSTAAGEAVQWAFRGVPGGAR